MGDELVRSSNTCSKSEIQEPGCMPSTSCWICMPVLSHIQHMLLSNTMWTRKMKQISIGSSGIMMPRCMPCGCGSHNQAVISMGTLLSHNLTFDAADDAASADSSDQP